MEMTIEKNVTFTKSKRMTKKKNIDSFSRKDWYIVESPMVFNIRQIGKTLVNRTNSSKSASSSLIGRVFDVSSKDLEQNDDNAHHKIRLRVVEVIDHRCLTNFWGMNQTVDRMKSSVRKWQNSIEANTEIRTTDGFVMRMFVAGFTKRRQNQTKKTSYAQSSQIRLIRRRMIDIIVKQSTKCSLDAVIRKFFKEGVSKQMEKKCTAVFPLHSCMIRKVKIIKAPLFEPQT